MKEEYMEINIEDTINRLHINEEMIKRLIVMTLSGDMLKQAEDAFASSNIEEAKRTIHTIKGTAANVGLVGLSKVALDIEIKIKESGHLDHELFEVLKEVWNSLKDNFL